MYFIENISLGQNITIEFQYELYIEICKQKQIINRQASEQTKGKQKINSVTYMITPLSRYHIYVLNSSQVPSLFFHLHRSPVRQTSSQNR